MTVQQPEWPSQSLSGQRQQQQRPGDDIDDNRNHLHSHQVDPTRPETPLPARLPDFPLPKSYTGPSVLRTSLRDNARNLNQNPSSPVMHHRRSSSSFSSVSVITNHLSSSLANVHPAPAYVGPFGATQVISEYQAGLRGAASGDDEVDTTSSSNDNITISLPALTLLNGFLDQLLFSFLAYAKSTGLAELRPAVVDVLMPRLAGEAIASAEEELQELLGDGGEEDMEERQPGVENQWDLELLWKRTRLRVMVYIRLGDMEDDDEGRFAQESNIAHNERFSQSSGLVSWAAAIFLTSIVEFVAERALRTACQAAVDRAKAKARYGTSPVSPTTGTGALTVEDYDMERVALDSGLSRLWRKWRKAQRNASSASSPQTPIHRHSRRQGSIDQTVGSLMSPRRSSFGTAFESPESRQESLDTARETPDDNNEEVPDIDYSEHVMAAHIPLPLNDYQKDVDEIEVPGLARDPDEPETVDDASNPRRNSFSGKTLSMLSTILSGSIATPGLTDGSERPSLSRQRSSSVPALFRISSLDSQIRGTKAAENPEEALEKEQEAPINAIAEQKIDATATATLDGRLQTTQKEGKPHETSLPHQAESTESYLSHGPIGGAADGLAIVAASATAATLSQRRKDSEMTLSRGLERQSLAGSEKAPRVDNSSVQIPRGASERSAVSHTVLAPTTAGAKTSPESTSVSQPAVTHINANTPGQVNGVPLTHETATYIDAQPYAEDPHDHREMSKVDSAIHEIGITQNSDVHLTASSPETVKSGNFEKTEAHVSTNSKTQPRRPAKLVLGTSATDFQPSRNSQASSQSQQEGHASPVASGLVEPSYISMSPHSPHFEKRRTPSPNEQTRFPAPMPANRNSAINANQRSLSTEKPAAWSVQSLVTDRSPQWPSSTKITVVPEPSPTVHEHPVIHRMASLKGSELQTEDKTQPLTSASIKGPEDFEMFVQGGDTVKYTLTPENVRDEPNPASQYYAKRSLDGMPPSPVKTTSPVELRAARTFAIKQALAAIPDSIMESSLPTRTGTRETRRSVSRPTARNTSVSRRTGYMAREPRVMTESTRDFADFIRSTGPDQEPQPVNLLASKSSSALHTQKPSPAGPPRSGSFGGVSSKLPNRSSAQSGRTPPLPSHPTGKSKSTMQPRAATSVSAGSAELIDFIRNGPNQAREHRISRTVAPFRTTMDSEQLNEWSDQILSQPDLILSNGEATATHKQSVSSIWSSNQASANSRSALITTIEAPLTQKSSNIRISESEPTRKAYRNKDPYAVPSDDEDDIFMNPPPRRNEESMMDFLRDTDPSVGHGPKPVSQGDITARRGSLKHGSGNVDMNVSMTGPANADPKDVTNRRSKALSGLQIATSAQMRGIQPAPTSAGTRKKLEARSPGTPARSANHDKAIHGGTSELVDFLRHSGPPEVRARSEPRNVPTTNTGRLSKPQPPPKTKPEKDRNGRRSIFGGSFFGRGPKKV